MFSFDAEAGKTYYVAYVVRNKQSGTFIAAGGGGGTFGGGGFGGGQNNGGGAATTHVDSAVGLVLLDEDDGKYRVKASKLSIATIQKPDQ
jgi:hypothetical protein